MDQFNGVIGDGRYYILIRQWLLLLGLYLNRGRSNDGMDMVI